jgi:hypothetical protein
MKRYIPLIITFLVGVLLLVADFIPHRPFGSISESLENWFQIIASFAMVLGALSLFKVNLIKIRDRQSDWPYYLISLICFILMTAFGFIWGKGGQPGIFGHGAAVSAWLGEKPFDYLFDNIYQHLSAAMFALLAFFIASAAYRAFIARTFESTLLLIAALLVMLGRTSIASNLTGWLPPSLSFLHLPNIADFIMKYPNTAGQRAVMISAGLGIVGSSLRIILGIERSYLGGD